MKNELVLCALVSTMISLSSNLSASTDVDTQDIFQDIEMKTGLVNSENSDRIVTKNGLFEILLKRGIFEEAEIRRSDRCGERC